VCRGRTFGAWVLEARLALRMERAILLVQKKKDT